MLAYHDRSDGGLLATVCEMMFAARCGVTLDFPAGSQALDTLFNEELGAVVQVGALVEDEAKLEIETTAVVPEAK